MEKPLRSGDADINRLQSEPESSNTLRVILELISYDRQSYVKHEDLSISDLLNKIIPEQVNWINLDGLRDPDIIAKLQTHFSLHTLLIDDVLNDQRPKAEEYEEYLFFTLKMLYRINGNHIDYEQISFVLGHNYLISFQEKEGDIFDSFRERIRLDQGRVRKKKADYLLYRLIDIIVDNYYLVLDNIGEQIEDIEDIIYKEPSEENFQRIQSLNKELIFLRKAVYPLRDALNVLIKNEYGFVQEENSRFYADVYDHVIHLSDSLDTYKDLVSGLIAIHINSLNTRMNEVMKVLTVISTIFIPLTFIVGVYGMNFKVMPELEWQYGYFAVWGIMIAMVAAMLRYFKFKKWF